MKYKNYYTDHPPKDTPIWAVAYDTDERRVSKRKFCKPVCGKIIQTYREPKFVPFKENMTELRQSGEVHAASRMYADTREEAIELLLNAYDERAAKLQKMMADVIAERNQLADELMPKENSYTVSIAVDGRIDIHVYNAVDLQDAKQKAETAFMTESLALMEVVGSHCVNATDSSGTLTDY